MVNEEQRAACWTAVNEGRATPDDWFPEAGKLNRHNRKAQAICGTCGMQQQCLLWALRSDRSFHSLGGLQGIWGGSTAHDRDLMRRRQLV